MNTNLFCHIVRLRNREDANNTKKNLRVLKTTAKNATKRLASDNTKSSVNQYDIKAEILKNVEEIKVSKIDSGISDLLWKIALTHDEKYLFTSSFKDISMIELETRSVSQKVKNAHSSLIVHLQVTRDDKKLISIDRYDKCAKIWTIDGEKKQIQLNYKFELDCQVNAAFLTLDEKELITGDDQGIKKWDFQRKRCVKTISNSDSERVYSLTVTKDKEHLISGSKESSISIWNFKSLTLLNRFKNAHFADISMLKLSEDEETLFSLCADSSIGVWDLKNRKNIHMFMNTDSQAISGIQPMNGDRFILSSSLDGGIDFWDAKTKIHLYNYKYAQKEKEGFQVLVLTRDNNLAIVTGEYGSLFFFDLGNQKESYLFQDAHTKYIDDIKITKDSQHLVTASDDGRVRIWDLQAKEMFHDFKVAQKDGVMVWKVALSPDNQKMATACSDGRVDLWDLSRNKHLHQCTFQDPSGAPCVIFNRDGSKIIFSSFKPPLYIYDVINLKMIHKIEDAHKFLCITLDTTHDDKYLVSGSMDKSIAVWDFESKQLVHRFENAHDVTIWSVRVTHDDKYVISSSSERMIKIWDLKEKRLAYVLETSHETPIKSFDISGDNMFLVSMDQTCNIEMHNLKTKQRAWAHTELRGLKGYSIAITPDNQQIIFGRDKSLHILENPFAKLTVQYSDNGSPYSLMRFLPLANYFLNQSRSYRQNIIRSYPEVKIHPYSWNWFHIVAIFSPNKEAILACLESQIPFTIDVFGKTPLHYLLDNDETEIVSLNLILAKFDVILQQSQRPAELLDHLSDIIFQLIQLDNVHVVTLLKSALREPEPYLKETVDIYGRVLRNQKVTYYPSSSMLYSQDIRHNLITETYKQKVTIQILPFSWAYSLTSDDMRMLVKVLKDLNHQGIFKSKMISLLINYLWLSSKNVYYFLGLVFSIQAILISIYTGYQDLGLEIPIFAISVFFLIYEICEIISDGIRDYFSSLWNYVDVAGNLLILATMIAIWAGVEDEAKNWLYAVILALTYIRWTSFFRAFNQTRKLIRMIIEIIKDIKSFAIVLTFVIFGLSLIYLQFDQDTPYDKHILNSYRLLYSDFDLDDLDSPGKMVFFLIFIAIISIVLLNMLITIMGNTFAEVQARGVIVDSKELLNLIEESIKVRRTLKSLTLRRRVHNEEEASKYMFIAEQRTEETITEENRVEEDISIIKDLIQNKNDEIDVLKAKVEEQKELQVHQQRETLDIKRQLEHQTKLQIQQGEQIAKQLELIQELMKIIGPKNMNSDS